MPQHITHTLSALLFSSLSPSPSAGGDGATEAVYLLMAAATLSRLGVKSLCVRACTVRALAGIGSNIYDIPHVPGMCFGAVETEQQAAGGEQSRPSPGT